jgi:hypothetical protein
MGLRITPQPSFGRTLEDIGLSPWNEALKNLNQTCLLQRRSDEPSEKRVRIERAALQFRVKLYTHEPWMIGPLDNFRKQPIG